MQVRGSITLIAAGGAILLCSTASAQWIKLVDKSDTRVVAVPALYVNDNIERAFAVADFDKDGDSDMAVMRKFWGSQTGGFANTLFMNEDGLLVDRTAEYASSSDVAGYNGFFDLTNDRHAIAVDVDNDTWLDLVTCTTMSDGVDVILGQPRVYMNLGEDGSGNWLGFEHQRNRIPQMYPSGGPPGGGVQANPRFCHVDAGDLNADGYKDLFFVDYDTAETAGQTTCRDLNNDGDTNDPGECQTSPGEVGSHDFNSKLLYNHGVSNPGHFYDTTTTVMTASQLSSAFGASVNISDMTGDGKLDVVRLSTLGSPQNVAVMTKATTGGSFQGPKVAVAANPYFHAPTDLNADGKLDLVVADDGIDRYLLNTGNDVTGQPNFSTHNLSGAPSQFDGAIHIADMDNDDRPDAFIADIDVDVGSFCPSSGRFSHIYRNVWNGSNPTNLLSIAEGDAALTSTQRQSWFDTTSIDIDGDGWLDLIVGSCKGMIVYMNRTAGIDFTYPGGKPSFVSSDSPTSFNVTATVLGTGSLVGATMQLNYRLATADGDFTSVPLSHVSGTTYQVTLPATECGTEIEWFVSGELSNGGPYRDPAEAPGVTYVTPVGSAEQVVVDNSFEAGDDGWTVENTGITLPAKGWESAFPVGTMSPGGTSTVPSRPVAPGTAAQGSRAFVTWNGSAGGAASASDLDSGTTRLLSPVFDIDGLQSATVSYSRWFYCDDSFTPTQADALLVEISNNGGASWVTLENVNWQANGWTTKSFSVTDYVTPTATMRLRFTVADSPENSVTEAGVDQVKVSGVVCKGAPACPGDIAGGDGLVDGNDLTLVLGSWGACTGCPADINDDGMVDGNDLSIVLGAWGACP